MPGRVRDLPPSNRLRSPSSNPPRSNGSRAVDAGMLDRSNPVAALPQAPQHEDGSVEAEAGPGRMNLVVDETGLAAAEAVVHQSGPQQEIRVEANAWPPAPRSNLTTEFSSKERALAWQTVPAVDDAIQHELRKSQLMQFELQTSKNEKLDDVAARPFRHTESPSVSKRRHFKLPKLVEDYEFNNKQEEAAEEQEAAGASSFRHSRGGKPNSGILSNFLLPKKTSTPISYKVPENYTRPPHPYDVGKVSQVNICPVCEKYTVTELDRRSCTTKDEALRARFKCGSCRHGFDLGIALFDPRGIPGVTLYEGEDRFRPPVPPPDTYPCPRCWKTADNSFQHMTCYLREESAVQCVPACCRERLSMSRPGLPEERIETRKIIRTVLGLF